MFQFSKRLSCVFRRSFITINCISESKSVSIIGWVNNVINLKRKTFVKIQDGRSHEIIQVVFDNNMLEKEINRGSCIKVLGDVVESKGKNQSLEMLAKSYEVLSNRQCDSMESEHPIQQLQSSKNTMLKPELSRKELLHLRHRLEHFSAIGRIRANTKNWIRNFMLMNEYLEVDYPCLTNMDCEGAGEVYKVVADDTKHQTGNVIIPKLTVSAQLHLEALALGFGKVYSMGPVFRANKSKTRHHLSEFVMVEAESIFIDNVSLLCDEIEQLVKFIMDNFIESSGNDMVLIAKSNLVESDDDRLDILSKIRDSRFPRIPFNECVSILRREGLVNTDACTDLTKVQEQHLVRLCGNVPVFVTDFPSHHKPFYCKSDQPGVALATDLLLPGVGEVVGGSLRENDHDVLIKRIRDVGLNENDMKWYLDLRSDGGCLHGGFGLGFDRLLQFMTGVSNIQDVVTFPRLYDSYTL